MKKTICMFVTAVLILCVSAGCSGGSSGGQTGTVFMPGMPMTSQGTQTQESQWQQPAQTGQSAYTGTWYHTYEYFDNQYHTTLVLNVDGSAAYYNDDTSLGNFSGTWYDTGSGISISRSDGVQSTAVIQNGVLIETTYEDGNYYQAEYTR